MPVLRALDAVEPSSAVITTTGANVGNNGSNGIYYLAAGCAVGIVVLFVVVIAAYCYCRRKGCCAPKGPKEAIKFPPDLLHALAKQATAEVPSIQYVGLGTTHDGKMQYATVDKEVDIILKTMSGEKYLESIRYRLPKPKNNDAEAERICNTAVIMIAEVTKVEDPTVDRAKMTKADTYEGSQVALMGGSGYNRSARTVLDASTMLDFYGRPIILSKVPTSDQLINMQWEMIWQRGIGLIVYVGKPLPYLTTNPPKPDQDSPRAFEVKILPEVERSPIHSKTSISLTNLELVVVESREVYILHIDHWPTNASQLVPNTLTAVLDSMLTIHTRQIPIEMSGILVHAEQEDIAAAIASMYVCRQMHIRSNGINVRGILASVEKFRKDAFRRRESYTQVQIVYAVARELIKTFAIPPELHKPKLGASKYEMHLCDSAVPKEHVNIPLACKEPKSAATKSMAGKSMAQTAKSLVSTTKHSSDGSAMASVRTKMASKVALSVAPSKAASLAPKTTNAKSVVK